MAGIKPQTQSLRDLLNNRNLDSEFVGNIVNDIKPKFYNYIPSCTTEAFALICQADKILLYYDPDVDGVMAGELASILLKFIHKPFDKEVNDNRFHGIPDSKFEKILKDGYDLILAVDFTIQPDKIQILNNNNIKVVCIDHHQPYDIPQQTERYVLVNNQYKHENASNSVVTLSGAGVVYYFISGALGCIDKKYTEKWVSNPEYAVMVGVSLLADSRDIENEICRYFLYRTYNEYRDTKIGNFILSLSTNVFDFGEPKIDRNFVDFEFSPTINALFRFNKGLDVLNAFDTCYMSSELKEFRIKQKELIKVATSFLRITECSNLVICEIPVDKFIDKIDYAFNMENFVGLVASRVKEVYGKTSFAFCKTQNGNYRGSVRGVNTRFDYLSIFRKYYNANGHKMAFGVYADDISNISNINNDLVTYEPYYSDYEHLNVTNLKILLSQKAKIDLKSIAITNQYLKSDRQILLRYHGSGLNVVNTRGELTEYTIDGLPVIGFGEPSGKNLIHPVIVRGYLKFLVV